MAVRKAVAVAAFICGLARTLRAISSDSFSSTQVVAAKVGDGLEVWPQTPQQYSEVARFAAIEGKTWNYPAITGRKLLVRNANEMAAYNIAAN